MKRILFFISIFTTCVLSFGQENKTKTDTAYGVPMIKASYAFQWPGGEMGKRFGFNSNVGGQFAYKTANNWYFGLKGNFIWGNQVKEDSILDAIKTVEGNVIDKDGRLTTIYLEERGFSGFLVGGRVFNQLGVNKNSGLLVYGGVGFLQHKIRIAYKDEITNLDKEYKKGYDRLSNGVAVNGFVGYIFLSQKRLINFFAGADFTQGWTVNRRGFNYDTMQHDTATKKDFITGIRLGWIIPIGKRATEEFYYF